MHGSVCLPPFLNERGIVWVGGNCVQASKVDDGDTREGMYRYSCVAGFP